MVVNRHAQGDFGVVLADDILVKNSLNLLGLNKLADIPGNILPGNILTIGRRT